MRWLLLVAAAAARAAAHELLTDTVTLSTYDFSAVVACDINGDGLDDLVMVCHSGNWVLQWLAAPSFTQATIIKNSGDKLLDVACADLDATPDGDMDLVVTGWESGIIYTLMSDGNASPQFVVNTMDTDYSSIFNVVNYVQLGDLNGDGDLDAVVSHWDTNQMWIEGPGPFDTYGDINQIGSIDFATRLCLADLDGDGALDIVFPFHADDLVSWFENDGAGGFVEHALPTALTEPEMAAAGDLDGDGDLDLVVVGVDSVVYFENSDGNGTFADAVVLSASVGARAVALIDLDFDGSLNIVAVGTDVRAWASAEVDATAEVLATGANGEAVVVFDADSDGDQDLCYVGTSINVVIIEVVQHPDAPAWLDVAQVERTTGALSASFDLNWTRAEDHGENITQYRVYVDDALALTTLDRQVTLSGYDFGQYLDFAVTAVSAGGEGDPVTATGVVASLRVEGSVTSLDNDSPVTELIGYPNRVLVGDLNGDGLDDLVVASVGSAEVVWYSAPDFSANQIENMGISSPGVVVDTAVGDLDGDGTVDVAVTGFTDDLVHLYFNVEGYGLVWEKATVATADTAYGVRIADVTGDGSNDLVFSAVFGSQLAYVPGPVVFSSVNASINITENGNNEFDQGVKFIEAADVDGDGVQDVLAIVNGGLSLRWYSTAGAGDRISSAGSMWRAVAGDIDGDGDVDVAISVLQVIGAPELGGLFIYSNDGAGAFTLAVSTFVASDNIHGLTLADLDRDGDLDVAFVCMFNYTLVWVDNVGNGEFDVQPLLLDTDYASLIDVAAMDFDDNGVTDLVAVEYSPRAGSGEDGQLVHAFVVSTLPDPPASVAAQATGDNGTVAVSWTAPDDGGAEITRYELSTGHQTADTTITVDGLANGVAANFSVRAVTRRGAGLYAADEATAVPWTPVETTSARIDSSDVGPVVALAAADFNNDGLTDFAVLGSEVVMYAALTDGTFLEIQRSNLGLLDPVALLVADLDADGYPDVLVSDAFGPQVYIFRNDPVNGLPFESSSTLSPGSTVADMHFADVNNDGESELVMSLVSTYVSFSRAPALDTLQVLLHSLSDTVLGHMLVADFTGDLVPDIVTSDPSFGVIRSWKNDGSGGFSNTKAFTLASFATPIRLLDADFDADGDLDVVVTTSDGIVAFENFTPLSFALIAAVSLQTQLEAPAGLLAADLNLDGTADLVFTDADAGTVSWLDAFGSDAARALQPSLLSGAVDCALLGTRLACAGTDTTAIIDILTVPLAPTNASAEPTGFDGELVVSWAPSAEEGAEVTSYLVTHIASGAQLETTTTAVTFTGLENGVEQLFEVSAVSYRGVGPATTDDIAGVPTTPVEVAAATQIAPAEASAVAVADMDGDSVLDLIAVQESNRAVSWYAGGQSWAATAVGSASAKVYSVAACDINQDAAMDVIVPSSDGTIIIFFGAEAGALDLDVVPGPLFVNCADVTGDGAPDLLFSSFDHSVVGYFAGPNPGQAGQMVNVSTSVATPYHISVADIDGDSAPDLLVPELHGFSWWRNNGTGVFTLGQEFTGLQRPVFALPVDLDSDGDLDVVLADFTSGDASVLENTNVELAAAVTVTSVSVAGMDYVAVVDLDLDGRLDLVSGNVYGGLHWFAGSGSLTGFGDAHLLSDTRVIGSLRAFDSDGDGDVDLHFSSATGVELLRVETVPFAPPTVAAAATGYSGSVLVSWDASDDNGGAVTAYSVYVDDARAETTTALEVVVADLVNGHAYNFTVTAENYRGVSAASLPAVEAVPTAPVETLSTTTRATDTGGYRRVFAIDGRDDYVVLGDGRFVRYVGAESFTVASSVPSSVVDAAMADVVGDDDGSLDLIVVGSSGALVVFGNDGGFSAGDTTEITLPCAAEGVAAVQGIIAFACADGVGVVVGQAQAAMVEDATFGGPVHLADGDGDGDVDLFVARQSNVQWFANGTDGFETAGSWALSQSNVSVITLGDLNADGYGDIVVSTASAVVVLYRSASNIAFLDPVALTASVTAPGRLRLCDLDLDGGLDVVLTAAAAEVLWLSAVDGYAEDRALLSESGVVDATCDMIAITDDAVIEVELGTVPLPPSTVVANATGYSGEIAVAWTESDGDGAPVTAYVVYVDGSAAGTFAEAGGTTLSALQDGQEYAVSVAAQSYRGVGPANDVPVTVVPTAPAAIVSASETTVGQIMNGNVVIAVDMNNDNVLDLLTASEGDDRVAWYAGPGFTDVTVVSEEVVQATDACTADLDDDGAVDIVAAAFGASEVHVFYSAADSVDRTLTLPFSQPLGVRIADFNFDGQLDIAVSLNNASTVGYFVGPELNEFHVLSAELPGVYSIEVADLDGDGNADLLAPARLSHELRWYMFRNATHTVESAVTGLSGPRRPVVGDANGDGLPDVLVLESGNLARLLWNVGGGELELAPEFSVETWNARDALFSDLDRDGNLDVVIASQGADEVEWYWNLGNGEFDTTTRTLYEGDGPRGVTVVDEQLAVLLFYEDVLVVVDLSSPPSAPTTLSAEATGYSGSVLLTWGAADDNGAEITSYRVSVSSGAVYDSRTTDVLELEVTGLTNGELYDFYVAAVSFRGVGDTSAVGPVAPTTPVEVAALATISVADVDPIFDMLVMEDGALMPVSPLAVWEWAFGTFYLPVTGQISSLAGVATGHLTDSGLQDIVLGGETGEVALLEQIPAVVGTSWVGHSAVSVGTGPVSDIVVAAFTDNELPDIVAASNDSIRMLSAPHNASAAVVDVVTELDRHGGLAVIQDSEILAACVDDRLQWYVYSSDAWDESFSFDTGGPCTLVRSGDIDGDDKTDQVVGLEAGGLLVIHGDLDTADVTLWPEETVVGLELRDIDLSGTVDIVASLESGEVRWISGLEDAYTLVEPGDADPGRLHMTDLDGDGDEDLVHGATQLEVFTVPTTENAAVSAVGSGFSGEITVSWFGFGGSDDITSYTASWDGGSVTTTADGAIVLAGLANGVAVDVEVTATNFRGTSVAVAADDSAEPFAAVEAADGDRVEVHDDDDYFGGFTKTIVVADVNGDGLSDVVEGVERPDGGVAWYESPDWQRHVVLNTSSGVYDVAVVDVDLDGDLDVVTTPQRFGLVHVLTNEGEGDAWSDRALNVSWTARTVAVAVGDVTGDGWPDVVFNVDFEGTFYVDLCSADPETRVVVYEKQRAAYHVVVVDLDLDGDNDVVVARTDELAWLLNNGTGGFLFLPETQTAGSYRGGHALHAGDVNGDGYPDFVATATSSDETLFFANNEGALTTPVVVDDSVDYPLGGVLADVDLDGDLDIVVVSRTGNGSAWYANTDGLGSFSGKHTLTSDGTQFFSMAMLEGDIVYSSKDGTAIIELLTAPDAPTGLALSEGTLSWDAVAATGDAEITQYEVLASPASSDGRSLWSTGVKTSSSLLALVADGAPHNLTVRALSYRGKGAWSSPIEYDSCFDSVVSGDETDVDCGGGACAKCEPGFLCANDTDCLNSDCGDDARCVSCVDGLQNQGESGVDCGGLFCGPCLRCSAADYSAYVEWDAIESRDFYVNSELVVSSLNASFAGLDNYEPFTTTVQAVGLSESASCTVTPVAPAVLGSPEVLLDVSAAAVALGDVDGDGFPDLFVYSDALELEFYRGNATHLVLTAVDGLATGQPALGDLDGDGDLDLAVSGSKLMYFYQQDNGSWVGGDGPTTSISPGVVALGDTAGADRVAEVFFADTVASVVYVLDALGSGEAVFSGSSVALCDVDGDGDVDALVDSELVENVGTAWEAEWAAPVALDALDSVAACATSIGVAYSSGPVELLPLQSHPEPPALAVVEAESTTALLRATLLWDEPHDGNSPIVEYRVFGNATADNVTTARTATFAVEQGHAYEWRAVSTNVFGDSAESDTVLYTAADVSVSATLRPRGEVMVNWTVHGFSRVDSLRSVTVNGEEVPTTVDYAIVVTDECQLLSFTVELVDAFNDSISGSAQLATPPLGVCPYACPSGDDDWVDPTALDPFQLSTPCVDGEWASLVGLTDKRREALLWVSSERREEDDAVRTDPQTNFTRQPASYSPTPVNISTEFAMSSNVPAATIEIIIDNAGEWAPWVEGSRYDYDADDESNHTVLARSVVGPWYTEQTPAEATWVFDETPPVCSFVSTQRPDAHTQESAAEFGLAASESGVVYRVCVDGNATCSTVTDTTDASVAQPSTELASDAVVVVGDDGSVELTIESDFGESLGVSVDSGEWTAQDMPTVELTGLADGWHSVLVRAVDTSGSVDGTPLGLGVSVGPDTVAPDTWVVDGPSALQVVNTSAVFEFAATEDDCVFEVSLDLGATWSAAAVTELEAQQIGFYRLLVRAVDPSGNVDPTPASWSWQVDVAPAPDTIIVNPPAAASVALSSSPLVLRFNATTAPCRFETSLDLGQTWSSSSDELEMPLDEPGFFQVLVRAIDSGGTVDPTPAVAAWQVIAPPVAALELAPPDVLAASTAVFAVSVDRGAGCEVAYSISASTSSFAESGTASDEGVIVAQDLEFGLYELVASAQCDLPAVADVAWQWEVSGESAVAVFNVDGLAQGEHEAAVYGTDRAGNVGPTAEYGWTVDQTAPDTFLATAAPSVITEPDLALDVDATEDECVFNVTVDGGRWELLEAPVVVLNLTDGAHALTVAAVDRAGNVDAEPVVVDEVLVDTLPPYLELVAVRGWVSKAPLFRVVCEDVTGCRNVTMSPAEPDLETEGAHQLNVTAADVFGNEAFVSAVYEVDTVDPVTVVYTSRYSVVSNASDWVANGTCVDLHRCWLNSSVVDLAALGDGNHSVSVWAFDEAGNVGETVPLWVHVDSVAPVLEQDGPVSYFANGGAAEVRVRCNDVSACVRPASTVVNVTGQPDGPYALEIGVEDEASNVGESLVVDLLFDTIAPLVNVTSAPPPYSADTEFVVEFEATDANNVTCVCSPWGCDELIAVAEDEAAVSFTVECVDVRGHATAAAASWTVDRVAPVVDLLWDAAPTNAPDWAFAWTVDDISPWTAECRLADPSGLEIQAGGCESPQEWHWGAVEGAEGLYTFNVSVTDALGHTGAAGVAFEYDFTAPTLATSQEPDTSTTLPTVLVSFGCVLTVGCETDVEPDDDCALSYSLNGGNVTAVDSGDDVALTVAEDGYGPQQVELFAVDAAGNNAEPLVVAWDYSESAVVPELTRTPAARSGWLSATFEWDAGGLAVWTRLNEDDWEDVGTATSANVTVPDLGTHTFSVAVVRSDPKAFVWEVAACEGDDEIAEVSAVDGALLCPLCPQGVRCTVGVPHIRDGWWWPHGTAEVTQHSRFYPCRVESACSTEEDPETLCREGYSGVLCDTCALGYGKTLELACEPCGDADNSGVVALAATLFSIALSLIAVFVVKKSLSNAETVRAVSTLKIMANYFLMMGILKDMDLDWGGMLTKLFSYMGVLSGGGAADLQIVNCVARVDTFDQFRLYFIIPAILVVAPWCAIWGFAGLRRLRWLLEGRPGGSLGSARIFGHSKALVYRQSLLVLGYFAYPVVVTNAFRVLYCTDIEDDALLVEDYSKQCSGTEYGILFATGVFFATVVALGVPFGIYWAMRRHHQHLTKEGKAQTQFFFFFGEFRPEWYWWEMTVMARKVAMGAIAVLFANHEQKMQVYIGTWLLLFSFTAQIACGPHKDHVQRNLETAAQGTVLASLLLGQGMAFADVTDEQRSSFEWAALLLNVAVMNGMGITLGLEVLKDVRRRRATARSPAPSSVELPALPLSSASSASAFHENPMRAAGTATPGRRVSTVNPLLRQE